MQIEATIEKILGGMMVVPLVLRALLNTLAPSALKIAGFTTAFFKNGAATLIGVLILCMGAGISLQAAPFMAEITNIVAVLIAVPVIITAIFTPILMSWVVKYQQQGQVPVLTSVMEVRV